MAEDSVAFAELRAQLAAEKEGRQAEKKGRQLEKEGRQAAEKSLDVATRLSTFEQYLTLLQKHYAARLSYDPKCPTNTKGGVTNPHDRYTPTLITPWLGFEGLQTAAYLKLCEVFQDRRLFSNEERIIGAQETIVAFAIDSEATLTAFTTAAEVAPALKIINQFLALRHAGGGPVSEVSFSTRGEDNEAAFAPVDGVWSYGGPILLQELKPPHKLTEKALETALDDGTGRPRKEFRTERIINDPHVTKDPTYTVTAVFTQVFDYMISSGIAHAYLDTGMACVFFQVRETEHTTLYYSLVIHPREGNVDPAMTSVCQIALFIHHCLTEKKRDDKWIEKATDSNAQFCVDPEAQVNLMSSPLPSPPELVTPGKDDYKPPRKRKRPPVPDSDRPPYHNEHDSSDDGCDHSSPIRDQQATRSRTRAPVTSIGKDAIRTTTSSGTGGNGGGTRSSLAVGSMPCSDCTDCTFCVTPNAVRQYCTQACLRGLMYYFCTGIVRELDTACPNATRHSKSLQHQLTLHRFHDSLRRQVDRSHVHNIEHLQLRGSSGHLFAITLCSHGYTFVGKGSRLDLLPTLIHELGIYETLHPLQGHYIPVCLGLLELDTPFYLPAPNHLTHFLLLSYSGIPISRSELVPLAEEVISSTKTSLSKLHDFGLVHRDFRVENMLWNTELHRAIIIDFGESALLKRPRASPSNGHHPSSVQTGDRLARVLGKLSSPSGVRKLRKTRVRHPEQEAREERERARELFDVRGEILRWLPHVSSRSSNAMGNGTDGLAS